MGMVMLQTLGLVVKVCAFTCFLMLQGSAVAGISPFSSVVPAVSPSDENTSGHVSYGKAFGRNAPASASQPNGSVLRPPLSLPPHPQMMKGLAPSLLPNAPALPPPYNSDPPPVTSSGVAPALPPHNPYIRPQHPEHPVLGPEAPVPVASPSRQSPQKSPSIHPPVPGSIPPKSHQNRAPINMPFAPVVNVPAPRTEPHGSPPIQLVKPVSPPPILPEPVAPSPSNFVKPVSPPSILPEPVAPSPSKLEGNIPPVQSTLPHEPPISSPGKHNVPSISAPSPGINAKRAAKPVAAPLNGTVKHHLPVNPAPTDAPSTHKGRSDSNSAFPPIPYPNRIHSPASPPSTSIQWHHQHPRDNTTAPAPLIYAVPPHAPIKQAPAYSKPNPKTNLGHHVLPPSKSEGHDSPAPSPSSTSQPGQTEMPIPSPKVSPPRSSQRNPKMPFQPPFQALPPPPPNGDCASLTCSEPLTNGLPGPPCICVLPIQAGLRLSVALYTFFPLVSELAAEISAGVFMKQSQVRIMGANAASQDPEKTIVLIDLVPLGEKFDNMTAYLTFQRFWHKQLDIKTSLFGNYEVLYVRYPGLPPSPPSASSDIDIINSDPYHGRDNNTRTEKPLGVDVKKGHKNGLNRSVIAIIVMSASVAVILCCAVAWVLLLRNRDCFSRQERTSPAIVPSMAKSSGAAASMVGSGPSSASPSLGSSIAGYAGSAKTFSSGEIEKATANFSETRVLGEGGFGRVYSGVLDGGTQVAVKILKRDDHQGGREFLAEIEMLSRLHHRNLVKLIGICTEERTRCLVYELIPNGSVESHLHGIDKETAPLDWNARLKIALGAARGLAYLHEDSSPRVIHRDFKSSNILLEHDFTPKVSDFGLARTALDEENRHISTRVMGTFGYVAPEYAMTGHLLVKSDVYSYGVVLLELLSGRKPVDMSRPPGEENLVSWARPLLISEEGLSMIVDPQLGPDFPLDSITKVAAIASMCVQPEVSHRPFMGEVVQALKLVCNECEETKELGSRTCSQEDLSIDMDARISTKSEHLLDPPGTQSPVSHYDPGLDIERGHSMSEILSSSANNGMPEYDPVRTQSSSGPLRTRSTWWLWQKMKHLSRGSVSEHGVALS